MLLEHCQVSEWSDWEWSNDAKKCGTGKRKRNIKVGELHGGDSCEKRFGKNFDKEAKVVSCKGI